MNGHLFGAGSDGAAQLRKQRQQDAGRRNAAARADRARDAETGTGGDEREASG